MTDDELDQRLRASILAEPVDTARVEAAVRHRIGGNPRSVPGWAVAAAAVVVTAGAAIFSRQEFIKEQQTPLVCVAAARDHQREIVKADPRPWLTDVSGIQLLGERQGVPVSAIAALSTTGYHLERARLCFLNKQIFLHLVYSKGGEEYSVYLRPRDSNVHFKGSVRETSVGTEELAYFQTDRLTAVFVDERSKSNALAFAQAGFRSLTDVAL